MNETITNCEAIRPVKNIRAAGHTITVQDALDAVVKAQTRVAAEFEHLAGIIVAAHGSPHDVYAAMQEFYAINGKISRTLRRFENIRGGI